MLPQKRLKQAEEKEKNQSRSAQKIHFQEALITYNADIYMGLAMMFIHVQAQTQPVKGHIYDYQTRQPLAGVILTTNAAQQVGKSNAKGYFEISVGQNELNVQLEADGVSPI